jgi:hypothetical protein
MTGTAEDCALAAKGNARTPPTEKKKSRRLMDQIDADPASANRGQLAA